MKTGYKYEEVDFSDGGDTYTFEQTVSLNFEAVEDMEIQVALSPEALESYNKANNTSLKTMGKKPTRSRRHCISTKGIRNRNSE